MLQLQLKRIYPTDNYTVGHLYVNGVYFSDTLEDPVREKKIRGDTCIPYGTYEITYNRSPKFKRDLPRLLDVPGFEGVLIHPGNTVKDTEGCILVGFNDEKGKLSRSRVTSDTLNDLISTNIRNGEKVLIEITG